MFLHPHCSSITLMQPSTDLICFPQKHSHQAFVCVTAITECLRRKKRADITTTQVPKTRLRHLLGHFHQLPAFPREVWFSLPLFSLPHLQSCFNFAFSLCLGDIYSPWLMFSLQAESKFALTRNSLLPRRNSGASCFWKTTFVALSHHVKYWEYTRSVLFVQLLMVIF